MTLQRQQDPLPVKKRYVLSELRRTKSGMGRERGKNRKTETLELHSGAYPTTVAALTLINVNKFLATDVIAFRIVASLIFSFTFPLSQTKKKTWKEEELLRNDFLHHAD